MSNQALLTLSQIIVALGLVLTALGGYGAYHFSKKIEREKEAKAAYTGVIKASGKILLSTKDNVWPTLEIGDSGAKLVWAGPPGGALIRLSGTDLTIVREDGRVKVSILIRDKTGAIVAELIKNEWKVNPNQTWDRNYSPDALEVIDPTGDVVLQVRALLDRVQLHAKLYEPNGRAIGIGKGPGGGIFEVTGPQHPVLKLKIERMFVYPSDLHLGETQRPPIA